MMLRPCETVGELERDRVICVKRVTKRSLDDGCLTDRFLGDVFILGSRITRTRDSRVNTSPRNPSVKHPLSRERFVILFTQATRFRSGSPIVSYGRNNIIIEKKLDSN